MRTPLLVILIVLVTGCALSEEDSDGLLVEPTAGTCMVGAGRVGAGKLKVTVTTLGGGKKHLVGKSPNGLEVKVWAPDAATGVTVLTRQQINATLDGVSVSMWDGSNSWFAYNEGIGSASITRTDLVYDISIERLKFSSQGGPLSGIGATCEYPKLQMAGVVTEE